MIEKLHPHNNGYLDDDDVFYETKTDYLMRAIGICGCGRPEAALRYVFDSMKLIAAMEQTERDDGWDEWYKGWRKAVSDHFGSDGAEYFMWYWLDQNGFTEHGGGVPGWLTDEGKDLLIDIAFVANEEKKR